VTGRCGSLQLRGDESGENASIFAIYRVMHMSDMQEIDIRIAQGDPATPRRWGVVESFGGAGGG